MRKAADSRNYYNFSLFLISLFLIFSFLLGNALNAQIVHQDFDHLNDLAEFRSPSPDNSQVDRINLNRVTSDGSEVFMLAEEGGNKFLRVQKKGRNMRHFDRTTNIQDVPTLLISFDFELIAAGQQGRIATWYIGDYLNPNSFFPEVNEKWAEIGIFANPSDNSFQLSSERASLSSRSNLSYSGKRKVTIVVNNSGESVLYDSPDGFLQLLPHEGLHLWVDQERQTIPVRPFLGGSAQQINAVKFLVWNTPFDALFHIDNLLITELDVIPVPLPVELLEFTARVQEGNVVLMWKTASEKNNSHFEIQRSPDGKTFRSIAQIHSAGNSTSLQSYSFIDQQVAQELAGSVYYRLKMVDIDNTFEYSPVELVSLAGKAFEILSVSPNPFREALVLKVQCNRRQLVEVALLDQQGALLMQQEHYLQPGVPELRFGELDKLSPGLYFLRIKASGYQAHYRVLKW